MRASDSLISLFPVGNVPPVETNDNPINFDNAPVMGERPLTEWEGKVSLEDVRGQAIRVGRISK